MFSINPDSYYAPRSEIYNINKHLIMHASWGGQVDINRGDKVQKIGRFTCRQIAVNCIGRIPDLITNLLFAPTVHMKIFDTLTNFF